MPSKWRDGLINLGQIGDLVWQAAIRQQAGKRSDEEWFHIAPESAGGTGTLDGGGVPADGDPQARTPDP